MAGSAGPVAWPLGGSEGWLVLVHEVVNRQGPDGGWERVYLHRFVECSRAFGLARITRPFVFVHKGVEFPCGMAPNHADDAILVGLGIEDAQAHLVRVPATRIEAMLAEGGTA